MYRYIEQSERIGNAWERHCPHKAYSGFTLETYRRKVRLSAAIRMQIQELKTHLQALDRQRHAVDAETVATIERIGYAVLADPEEGPNGKLYPELGFPPRKKRNRRRRPKTPAKTREPQRTPQTAGGGSRP